MTILHLWENNINTEILNTSFPIRPTTPSFPVTNILHTCGVFATSDEPILILT